MNSHGTDENDWRCLFLGKYNYRNETEKTHTQYEFMPTKLSASNIIHKQFSVNG